MRQIPLNQKIRTIDASVDTTERQSKLINSKSEVYTMGDVISTVLPYKFLSLRMTQKGNNDPVYTVLANTLDFDVESLDVNRTGTGEYLVRLFSDVLTDLKTSFVVGFNPLGSQIIFSNSSDRFIVSTFDLSGNLTDEVLDGTLIEVRVYA